MYNKDLTNFDQLIKSKLDAHKETFQPSDWDSFESKLPKSNNPGVNYTKWILGSAATLAIIVGGLTWSYNNDTSSEVNNDNKNELIVQNETINSNETISTSDNIEANKSENNPNTISIEEVPSSETDKVGTSPLNNVETNPSETPKKIVNTNDELSNSTENGKKDNVKNESSDKIVIAKPKAVISCKSSEQCEGAIFVFTTESQTNVDYSWSFGDEQFSKEQNPSHKYKTAGSFKVGLIVRSTLDNSIVTKANDILINVLPSPKVSFETEEQNANGIPSISFINTTDKATSWSWNMGDGYISEEKDPNHNFRNKGIYPVSLLATNEEGCSNSITKKVRVESDYNLLAPNSFTPNNDGLNDFFIPEALKVMDVEFKLSIYGTTEGLLFESQSINNPWNGINQQNGENCPSNNYIWVVTLTNSKGEVEQYKGAVLLLK